LLKNRFVTCLLFGAIFGAEYYAFISIDNFSSLFKFKCYNVFSVLFWNETVSKYVLVPFFGKNVEWRVIVIPLLIISVSMMAGLCCLAERSMNAGLKTPGIRWNFGLRQHKFIFKESRKMLIDSVFVLALIVCFFTSSYAGAKKKDVVYTAEDAYYRNYAKDFSGELDEEKKAMIAEEKEKISAEKEKYTEAGYFMENKLRDCEYREEALRRIEEDVSYLETKKGAWIVYEKGYEELFNNRNTEILLMCITICMACICSVLFWSMEYHGEMKELLVPTSLGWKKIRRTKQCVTVVMALFLVLAIYLPFMFNVVKEYGIKKIGFPAYSIKALTDLPSFVSFGLFMAFVMFLRFLTISVYTLLLEKIVKAQKSALRSIMTGLIAGTLVPIVIILLFGLKKLS